MQELQNCSFTTSSNYRLHWGRILDFLVTDVCREAETAIFVVAFRLLYIFGQRMVRPGSW